MNNIAVSVVMPIYNSESYLNDSLNDILNQTFENFELICVNDGSTDKSGEILDRYSNLDERIKVINQTNSGGGVARNRGLEHVRGKYVMFLDSDDRFETDMLEQVYKKAEKSSAQVVVFDGDTFDDVTGIHKSAPWLIRKRGLSIGENPFDFVNTSVWNKMFLCEYIKKHKIRFQENRIVDTMYFVFIAIVLAEKITIMPKILVHYRTNNSNSIISNSDKFPLEAYEALLYIKEKLKYLGCYDVKKRFFSRFSSEYLRERLSLMKTARGFAALYNKLHESGIDDLEFDYEELTTTFLNDVKNKYLNEYLFDKVKYMQEIGITGREVYIFPTKLRQCNEAKIALYGGGEVGKNYFMQLMNTKTQIVAWVDENYKRIGYPLESPEILRERAFDTIVIAVLNEKDAKCIRERLHFLKIDESKIYWEKPVTL